MEHEFYFMKFYKVLILYDLKAWLLDFFTDFNCSPLLHWEGKRALVVRLKSVDFLNRFALQGDCAVIYSVIFKNVAMLCLCTSGVSHDIFGRVYHLMNHLQISICR